MELPVLTIHELSKGEKTFTHVVVAAYFEGKWLWVKHKERETWELPAGHIEAGETPCVAAMRELYEETGTLNYRINPLCDFSITHRGQSSYNRFYLAVVSKLGTLPKSEIEEVKLFDAAPEELTYPSIQSVLFAQATKNIKVTD
jgi:8-oxo-dGTP diphosphatase